MHNAAKLACPQQAKEYNNGFHEHGSSPAPYRAESLAGLPPAYIDVGECDVFRDPVVAYATNMWRCGSTCELHVWPGAFHLFDGMDNPDVPLIHAAIKTKKA
ncbi:esterase/lipase [Grosmannia clavigera kw1407]|uniref:Esterase/lipase n=1 Tax=Grosmannia clavigera (strain kw1407 / UAMH 11150) TaxID=655863 RepID=F0XA06_GROCL|nr:esterase/lipase [Grosmannia clavigera kw1407]EFX05935.1 esterase/lipase [Grosmannia clavigera kw1407]